MTVRKPIAMKIIQGTDRKDRRPKNEIKVKPLTVKSLPPSWLCDEAKMEWAVRIINLEQMGILSECDLSAFARYCQAQGMYEVKMKEIQQYGDTSIGEKGIEYEHPRSYLAERYRKAADQIGAKFGFNPSDRGGININNKKEEEDIVSQLQKKTS